jgi:hypothetical protein
MGVKNRGHSLLKNTEFSAEKRNILLKFSVTCSVVSEHIKTMMQSVSSVLYMRVLGPLLNLSIHLLDSKLM